MKDIFLADAHLRCPEDANYRALIAFLEKETGDLRTLYLLGDILEFWIGYRHTVFSAYVPILETLGRLRSRGVEIVYVEGNHDFHLGPFFSRKLGCRILPSGGEVRIDGRRVHIAHGDLVNPKDRGYRLLRATLRSAPMRALMSLFPPDLTWGIAQWASRQSSKSHAARNERWVPRELLLAYAGRHFADGCEVTVTGHFHSPLMEQTAEGTMIALGDWITQYSYAVCENGRFSLETYEP